MTDEWMDRAGCLGLSPDRFHRKRGDAYRRERPLCLACPVRIHCLRYALDNHITAGLWGGLDERERERILLKRRRVNAKRRAS